MRLTLLIICGSFVLFSCGNKTKNTETKHIDAPVRVVNIPSFNEDSAYFFVKKQVDFGPRVPNTQAHKEAGDYFIKTFEQYGAEVTVQEFESVTFDAHRVHLRNIIASFSPEKKKRILLASHWDTRPFADKDTVKRDAPFDGANDGASGVGILLEMARTFHTGGVPDVGVDMILFDGEDWGEKEHGDYVDLPKDLSSWWCLGSQYWAKNKHKANYSAYYGILLDMVGASNATFRREELSLNYAPKVVERIWDTAEKLGYSHIFVKQNEGAIMDDHKFVNEYAKIPMVDIVHYDTSVGYFGSFHHTTADNIGIISKKTLGAVGKTLMHVVYYEEAGA